MAVPTSVIHMYNGSVTLGGSDGNMVTETAVGGNRILIELNRSSESNLIRLAIRATTAPCYLIKITSLNNKILLSLDAINWTSEIKIFSVGTVNSIFFVKSYAEDDEAYGDIVGALTIEFYAPV